MGFVDSLQQRTGTERYVNSGVISRKEKTFQGAKVLLGVHGFREFTEPGDFGYDAILTLDPNYTNPPHIHPGGELAVILNGMYFDGNNNGDPLHEYPEGTTVWYNKFSIHRPMTGVEGVRLYYVSFNGFVEKTPLIELLKKAKQLKAPEDAMDNMLRWAAPDDPRLRQALMDELFSA